MTGEKLPNNSLQLTSDRVEASLRLVNAVATIDAAEITVV
jgi:hypothetical protein